MDSVLYKKSDSENMTSEELRKFLAPFICRKDKLIPKKENYLRYVIVSGYMLRRGREEHVPTDNNISGDNFLFLESIYLCGI